MTIDARPAIGSPRRGWLADPARRHEVGVLAASRPAFPVLLRLGRHTGGIRRLPGIGWVVADASIARRILTDTEHFTIVGEGVVGHLWAALLGDWVYELLDGAGHQALRTTTRELFTQRRSAALVARAAAPRLRAATAVLRAGGTVDVADLSREVVGRIVADLLGLGDPGLTFRDIYAAGERLAALALRTTAHPRVDPRVLAAARSIVDTLTGNVATAWREAPADTLLGHCREVGLGLPQSRALAVLLMVAGTQTTASAVSRTVALLHDTGEQHRLRAQPWRIDDAVREGLRVTSPVPVISRSVTAGVDVAGSRLRAGDRVLVLPHAIHQAEGGFDLDHEPTPGNRRLWFGAGRHYCLGSTLGTAQVSAMLGALLDTDRAWNIVRRRYGFRALIPTYTRLEVRLG